jgi:hypothetical protein
MSWFHICELLSLAILFLHDAVMRPMTLAFRVHHIFGIVGVCLQIHIGVGGTAMSYLLFDQVTDYVRDPVAFWITFLVVRICFYNVMLTVAVMQGIRAAQESMAIAVWVGCVIIWFFYANFYHLEWAWRERKTIRRVFSSRRQ